MTLTHKLLVELAAKRIKTHIDSISLVLTELKSFAGEIPDVIAFRYDKTILIECKTSRADFLRNKNKNWYKNAQGYKALGHYRIFFAPEGLIKTDELPALWGLITVSEHLVTKVEVEPRLFYESDVSTGGHQLILLSKIRRQREEILCLKKAKNIQQRIQ